jgi:hypothetical protein
VQLEPPVLPVPCGGAEVDVGSLAALQAEFPAPYLCELDLQDFLYWLQWVRVLGSWFLRPLRSVDPSDWEERQQAEARKVPDQRLSHLLRFCMLFLPPPFSALEAL